MIVAIWKPVVLSTRQSAYKLIRLQVVSPTSRFAAYKSGSNVNQSSQNIFDLSVGENIQLIGLV